MMARRKVIRKLTAARREGIHRLADILHAFLPLSSPSRNTVTFRTIFAQSGIQSYLDGPKTKKQALQQGFGRLYRYHRRLPFLIVRKIIPAAIDYRLYKRDPLCREELDALAECLYELGVDMRKEIAQIRLDERLPPIVIPPEALQKRLRNHDLDPALETEPLTLFLDGYFNEAVRKAVERFEDRVRRLSGNEDYGTKLMGRVFVDGSLLQLDLIRPVNRKDFVRGYQALSIGMISALRNVFSHGDESRRSPEECFEMLLFVNWMFRGLRVVEKG